MARLGIGLIATALVRSALATQWIGAMETPMGLMADAGISPKPTAAPGFDGIPKELRRRQSNPYAFPPPDNWCGFVSGLYADPLSCSAGLTCIFSGAALGCCTATTGTCTNIYTSCADYGDSCDSDCQADDAIRKCGSAMRYCGTFSFFGGTYLYNCQSTRALAESVEFLNDFYIRAIGSTLATDTESALTDLSFGSSTRRSTPSDTSSSTYTYNRSAGLAAAAIGGICAGVGVLAVILGVIIFFCIRRRRNNRIRDAQQQSAAAQAAYGGPAPMQQQSPGYQPVPQQDGQYLSPGAQQSQPQPQPQPYAPTQQGYFDPSKSPANTYVTPVSPASNGDPRQSMYTGSGVTSPVPTAGQQPTPPPVPANESYYKPPQNANTMEVDGTQGNPGVPHGGQHGYQEVDGTKGNPGVPYHQGKQQGPYEIQ